VEVVTWASIWRWIIDTSNVCIDLLNSQIWKEIMLELNGKPSSVITFSTDFSLQNLVFWNLFEFLVAEITLKSISLTFWIQILPNKIPLNPAHQDLSNNYKGTFQFLLSFQLWFNLIFSEEIIQYSRTSTPQVQTPWNQANAPLLLKSFPKGPRTQSEASQFSGSYKYGKNKSNKLPPFKDRWCRVKLQGEGIPKISAPQGWRWVGYFGNAPTQGLYLV